MSADPGRGAVGEFYVNVLWASHPVPYPVLLRAARWWVARPAGPLVPPGLAAVDPADAADLLTLLPEQPWAAQPLQVAACLAGPRVGTDLARRVLDTYRSVRHWVAVARAAQSPHVLAVLGTCGDHLVAQALAGNGHAGAGVRVQALLTLAEHPGEPTPRAAERFRQALQGQPPAVLAALAGQRLPAQLAAMVAALAQGGDPTTLAEASRDLHLGRAVDLSALAALDGTAWDCLERLADTFPGTLAQLAAAALAVAGPVDPPGPLPPEPVPAPSPA